MEGFRKRRFDGIYAERIRLVWDTWRNSRLRKIVLAFSLIITLLLSTFYQAVETTPTQAAQPQTYTGKHLRTVEFNLGGSSDNNTRSSGTLVYAGSSWNTTKASAGTRTVALPGSNVRVVNAYLEFYFNTTAATSTTNIAMTLDVSNGPNPGTDVRVAQDLGVNTWVQSGQSYSINSRHDSTALFTHQTSAQLNSGVTVVAGTTVTGPSRRLSALKLVITYETDYSIAAHTQLKTVRFPLNSTASGDTGTRQTACAASSNCDFAYLADIPDAAADADIKSVWFEIGAEVDSGTASTLTPTIVGGTAGPAFNWTETTSDDQFHRFVFVPTVGGSNFNRNTAQTLRLTTGSVAVSALGGELVVTYEYSTGATTQTETTNYYMYQHLTAPSTTKHTFSRDITISNTGRSVKNLWFRVQTAQINTVTLNVYGTVGGASEKSNGYDLTPVNNARAGGTPTIIYDMTADASSFNSATTTIAGAVEYSAANGSPPGVELFVTFTWNGSLGGTQTKTVAFVAEQQGANATASQYYNTPVTVTLPETVTKTYRSAFVATNFSRSNGTSVTVGTVTTGISGTEQVYNETADATSESYWHTVYQDFGSTLFSGGATINWTRRTFEIQATRTNANTSRFSHVVKVTYDAALGEANPQGATANKQLRTVEFNLGGSSDNNTRSSGTLVYAGSSWNTTKASAGTRTVALPGSNVRVVNAYLEFYFNTTASANTTNIAVTLDVSNGPNPGTDVRVAQDLGVNTWVTSGQSYSINSRHDSTALFTHQTSAQLNSGVTVVAGTTVTGPSRRLSALKLVITYETDYSIAAHTQLKTVRFPLDSTASGDTGTRQTACAASSNCDFAYLADIPDAAADADIKSVWFEIGAEVDSGTASTLTPTIVGGTAGPAFNWTETTSDDQFHRFVFVPTVGGSNFNRNTAQTLRLTTGSVAVSALGGELVVTYEYSTGATTQTETTNYYMYQHLTAPSTTKHTFSRDITISNTGRSVKNLWFRVQTAQINTVTLNVYGTVGGASEKSNGYDLTPVNNARAGGTPTIIYDMTADASSFNSATTTIAGAVEYSAANGSPPGVELFVTFTWNGSLGGTQTKTVAFVAEQQGANATASQYYNTPVTVTLPETVTKTYRSAFVATNFSRSNGTSVTVGTVTTGISGTEQVYNETADATSESYWHTVYQDFGSTLFSGGSTINWTSRTFEMQATRTQANTSRFSHVVKVTYDAAMPLNNPRLWSSGAELNSTAADMEVTSTAGTVSISSSTKRSGNYAYRANPSSSTGSFVKTWANSAQQGLFWARTYVRVATAPGTLTSFFVLGQSTNNKVGIRMNSDRTLEFWNEEDSAQIGSDTFALNTDTWYRLEVFVNNTTLSSTEAELRIDGRTVASSSSLNLAAGLDRLTWGVMTSTTADLFFDDLAINQNTEKLEEYWPGEGKIVHMLPNANGDTNSWARDPVNCNGSSNNYECVDEETPNDNTDFLRSQTNNQVQEVNLVSSSAVGIASGDTIKLASVGARIRACGNATGGFACDVFGDQISYQTRIKPNTSGTVLESARITITDSDSNWRTNDDDTAKLNKLTAYHQPGTTDPWTPAVLDTAQIGIANRDAGSIGFRVTAIWLQVEYVPAGGGRIFSSGFELNSTTAGMEWTSFTGSPTIVTSPVRSGSYALQTASGGAQSFAQYHFAAANQDGPYFVRVYARVAETPESEFNIIELRDTSNNARAYITLDGSRQLRLYDEDGVIGSASSALSTATWYRLEIEFSTVPSAGSHVIKARVDGSEFAAATNRNISTGIARLAIGSNINVGDVDAGQLQYDDIAINTNFGATQNSYPGEGKIVHLRPNAAGDLAQWSRGGTDSGANWSQVDEITPNDATDFNFETTTNNTDDYNINDSPLGSADTVAVVSVGVRFRANNSTKSDFRLRIKDSSNGAVAESASLTANSTTWSTNTAAGVEPREYQLNSYTRPGSSGLGWSDTALDGAQVGLRHLGGGRVDVTAVWVLVDYEEVPVTISISGRVFTDEGSTGLDCTTPRTVRVKVNGAGDYAASCSNSPSNGSYTVSGISITAAGDVLTVFLDGATEKAVTVSRAADTTSNITSFDLYQNRVITRHEDAGPLSIANLDQYDSGNDADIQFTADTDGEPHTLTVASGAKLLVWTGKTFTPGGTVTTTTGATPSGDVLIQSSAVLNMGGNALSIGGSYQNSGTFTSGSNTTTFTSTSTGKTLGGTMTSSSAFYNVVFNGSGGGWTLSADFEATNNFSITNGTFDTNNSGDYAVTVGGNLTGNSGTWTLQMRGSTWTVSGNWDTSAVATDYDNIVRGSSTLVMNGSGTKTLKTGSTDIWQARFHNLTVAQGSGKTTQLQQSVGFSGVLTVGSGGDGTFDLNNFIIYAAESTTASPLSLNGTFGTGNGTLSFWGNINKNLPGHTYNSNYTNELSTGFKLTQQGAVTFTGNFTLGCCSRASEHDTNNYNLTVNGSVTWDTTTAILTAGSSTINVGNDWNNANAAVFNAGTSTVNFNKASGTQTLTSGGTGSTKRFYNLTHSGAGTLSLATHAVEIQNDLSNSGGTMSGSVNVTVNGHATGVGAITMSGSSTFTQRVSADKNFGTTSGSAAWSFVNLTFASDGSIDTITTQSGGSGAINISGNMRVGVSGDAGRTILNAGSRTWALSGTGGNPLNTDEDGNGSRITAATSTFTFTGNNSGGNTTIEANANGGGYYNLTVGCLGLCTAEIYELEAATVVANNLVIQDSNIGTNTLDTVSGQNYALTVGGNLTNNDAFTARNGTVTLNGSSTQTVSGTWTGSSSFYNLTITNNSGASATSCERDGFTASVDFNAAVTVSNNYTITTANVRIEYNSGSTYTFTNINWNGQAAGTRIYFRNSAASGTWLLNVSGTQTAVSYVNVSRSDASGGDTINAADGTNVDCGNNTNWDFGASTFEQAAYRFGFSNGTNTDIVYTGAPSQDTPLTIDNTGDNFRLRLLIHVGGSDLSVNGNHFKLQFGEKTAATCASGVSWGDVGTGAGVIRYYNDSAGSDGDAISNVTGDPSHSGHTRRYQTYEETNNFTNSQAAIAAGEDGVWDFSLINHSAVGGKKYCFRVFDVTNDGVLSSYSVYPEIVIEEELIFTLDATSKNFGVIQPGDNPTEQTSTVTVTTNSSTGYIIYAWATQKMTLTNGFGTFEIPDWTGTNATPTAWPDGSFGFGYTTDDGDLTGGTANRFTDGGPKFAAFVNTGPGDPVADRSSGPVSSAANNITYRLAAGTGQQAGTYNTIIVYVVSVTF